MNAPLKPTATNVLTSNSNASTAILNDLVSRMNAQAGGTMQEEQKTAFSRWLERHSTNTASADAPNQADKVTKAAARASDVQHRTGQEVKASVHADAPERPNTKAKTLKNDANKSKPVAKKEATPSAHKAEGKDKAEAQATDDEVKFATQMGEGSAIVRELLPPTDVQRGDPAAMMAWLAGLSQSDEQLAQAQADAKAAGLGKSEGRDGHASSVAALHALLSGRSEDKSVQGATELIGGDTKKSDPKGLDVSAWQAAQSTAQLAMQNTKGTFDLESRLESLMNPAVQGTPPGIGMGPQTAATRDAQEVIHNPVTSAQFSDELAEKVAMFVKVAKDDGPLTAELRLNPVDMGPINVRIEVDGANAHVDFAATVLETRQAIEASLSALSSSLEEVGLSLTGGNVSSQTPDQQAGQFGGRQPESGAPGRTTANGSDTRRNDVQEATMRPVHINRFNPQGGLDLYA